MYHICRPNERVYATHVRTVDEQKANIQTHQEVPGNNHTCHHQMQNISLFTLLFCTGVSPVSLLITKTGYRYKFRTGVTISHLTLTNPPHQDR